VKFLEGDEVCSVDIRARLKYLFSLVGCMLGAKVRSYSSNRCWTLGEEEFLQSLKPTLGVCLVAWSNPTISISTEIFENLDVW
jgi:hypothetical protein